MRENEKTSNIVEGAAPIVDEKPIAVDQSTMTCNQCKVARVVALNPPLVGSEAIVGWLKTAPTPCTECGCKQLSLDMRTCPVPSASSELQRDIMNAASEKLVEPLR